MQYSTGFLTSFWILPVSRILPVAFKTLCCTGKVGKDQTWLLRLIMWYVRIKGLLVIDLSCMVCPYPPKAAVKYRWCVCVQKVWNHSSFPMCLSVTSLLLWHFSCCSDGSTWHHHLEWWCSIFQDFFQDSGCICKTISLHYVNCQGKKIQMSKTKDLRVLKHAGLFVIPQLCKVHCKASELGYKFHSSPTLRC